MHLEDIQAAADRVSELMKLLANKHRLLVLCQLAEGEKSVGELARLLGMREPAMSQQLAVLRREGLIRPRREGQTIYYGLARDDVRRLMEFLYATYCGEGAGKGDGDVGTDLEADRRRERKGPARSG
jgi:ArsR family transcriptional regulator, virulence genes transcriptional regulator